MKFVVVLAFLVVSSIALPRKWNHVCEKSFCQLPCCQCSEITWQYPGDKPQFVVLSFDDAVTESSYNEFIKPTFVGRKNPDGCPISGTFFVPHEYTNYSVVNKLYRHGFEIGSHSITKNYSQDYWRTASISTLSAEFAGQRTILYTFANIPYSDISGVRVPQLQLNGNTFRALYEAGFKYDASWPTQQPSTLYPYTLDYSSLQSCHTVECQVQSTPGLWEMPIVDWKDGNGASCNSVHACAVEFASSCVGIIYAEPKILDFNFPVKRDESYDTENITEWMVENYNEINKSGAPISLRISYSWFLADENHGEALNEFLDYLQNENNTYIASYKQVLRWSEDPSKKFSSCQNIENPVCVPRNCNYTHENVEHVLNVCVTCPLNYPWIHNPTGQ